MSTLRSAVFPVFQALNSGRFHSPVSISILCFISSMCFFYLRPTVLSVLRFREIAWREQDWKQTMSLEICYWGSWFVGIEGIALFSTLGEKIASALRLKDLQLTILDFTFGFLEIQTLNLTWFSHYFLVLMSNFYTLFSVLRNEYFSFIICILLIHIKS